MGMNHRAILQRIARRAMLDKGFLIDFTESSLAIVDHFQEMTIKADEQIRDLRNLNWCSIDNDDSRDLDQLSVAVPITRESTKILVAIADVDSRVDKESALEEHARHNTTSVYTSAQIFPMLPEKLSTDLTSLKFNADRLAIVVEFIIKEDGTIQASDIYQAMVLNKAKLAYHSLGAWLDESGPEPDAIGSVGGLDENIRLQDKVAKKLKTLRYDKGALYLETVEARPVFEENEIRDVKEETANSAMSIIQEFMIAANSVVVRFLYGKNFPTIRRVVRVPKRWDRIVELASEWKYKLPVQPDARELDKFLLGAKTSDPVRFPDLSLCVIKLLGSGEYVAGLQGEDAEGHFGLAVKDYTHSTAPNRRYPDLITQRLLKAALAGNKPPYAGDELKEIATHCTTMEDAARKVERQVEKSTAALLFENRIGGQFDGIITGASDKGTWVRILHPPVEGKLVSGFENMDVGDRIRVQLAHTDVERGFIDFRKVK
jgi:VacB/RNase II family 3'-5' exoribonuclease